MVVVNVKIGMGRGVLRPADGTLPLLRDQHRIVVFGRYPIFAKVLAPLRSSCVLRVALPPTLVGAISWSQGDSRTPGLGHRVSAKNPTPAP